MTGLFPRTRHYVKLSQLMDNSVRQVIIRKRLQAGQLPREHTIELWHGPGFGQICDGCGAPIQHVDGMCLMCGEDWRAIRLHDECFFLWEEECRAAPAVRAA